DGGAIAHHEVGNLDGGHDRDATVTLPMIDIRLVRADAEAVKRALARKRVDPAEVDRLAELDRRAREATAGRDELRARVKALSKDVATAKRAGDGDRAAALSDESRRLGDDEKQLDAEAAAIAFELHELLLRVPNLPAADALDGESEADNQVVRTEGFDPAAYAAHQRVPHWEIGAELGVLDPERAVKISGSMFNMTRRLGATLSRGLCQL